MVTRDEALKSARWKKSSRSGNGAQCVELAALSNGEVAVRDSKNAEGSKVYFSESRWRSFLAEWNH